MTPRGRLAVAAIALSAGLTFAACEPATDAGVACPLLAPGSLSDLTRIEVADADFDAPQTVAHAPIPAGSLAVVPFASQGAETVTFQLTSPGALSLFAWGPRDGFGGYPHCIAVGTGKLTFRAAARGEYLIGAGPAEGSLAPIPADSLRWRTTRVRDAGADATGPCPTLESLGCGNARCDGELARDADGCLTCTCLDGALCGPERSAGPSGSCILPACTCDGVDEAPVCGADGMTWPSACAAQCAGVAVIKDSACETACPALATCENPCFGPRRIDAATGCPSCACLGDFAPDADSCKACPLDPEPVCGSDGRTWPNRCRARCGGARILYAGSCDARCRRAPADCTLDCPYGLAPATDAARDTETSGECLTCRCATGPGLDCPDFGANACAVIGADSWTTPNACVAASIGATAGRWGACAVGCAEDADCQSFPASADDAWNSNEARCLIDGFFEGRCFTNDFMTDADCGCSSLLDPVCGSDGATYANACRARCLGATVAHRGTCCRHAEPQCDDGMIPVRDEDGCPVEDGRCAAVDTTGLGCAANAAAAPACTRDGDVVIDSACDAALQGIDARPEFCR